MDQDVRPAFYPGDVIDRLPNEHYHGATDFLGSTSLKTLARPGGPALWKWQQGNPQPAKDEYEIGSVAHSLILEGDESKVWPLNYPDKRSKSYQGMAAALRTYGFVPLLTEEWDMVRRMRDSVMAHDDARYLLTGHVPERSYFAEQDGVKVKARADAAHPGIVADLKTVARDVDPGSFTRTVYDFGYFQQEAHYRDTIKAATGEDTEFYFIAVSKTAPHLTAVHILDAEAVEYGRRLNTLALDRYRRCTETGEWPGHETTVISLPGWARRNIDNLLGETA